MAEMEGRKERETIIFSLFFIFFDFYFRLSFIFSAQQS